MSPLFTVHTMTPDEETAWATMHPVPNKGHVVYLLRKGGLRPVDIDAFFQWREGHASNLSKQHRAQACWWCAR